MSEAMNWSQLLEELHSDGADLKLENDKLVYDGPSEKLTPQRLQLLRSHKADIMHFLLHDVTHHPLSYGQQALWFKYQMAPESFAYNVSAAVRIQSPVDLAGLEQACQRLVSRHAALRTTFAIEANEPIQIVHRYQPITINRIDATAWDEATLYERVVAATNRTAGTVSWRINLWLRPNRNYIRLGRHHPICAMAGQSG
ncbi:MAG: condensation domain-containing protein [Caldilineaceae bacterium]